MFSQSVRNLGPDTEEGLKRRHTLVDQHAQAIDGLMTTRPGVFQQCGFLWVILFALFAR